MKKSEGVGLTFMDIRGKSILGRGNSQCKGPEAGVCLVSSRDKEVSVTRAEVGNKVKSKSKCGQREIDYVGDCRPCEDLAFSLSEMSH